MNFDLGRFLRDAGRLTVTGAFGALVVLGTQQAASAQDGTVVQGSNSSIGARSRSGAAVGVNAAGANAGPTARSVLGRSQAQQVGDNTTVVSQDSTVKSGDAVAGSQVTGVVSGGGDVVVQNQNSSIGGVARSGPAVGVNVVSANSGPSAGSLVGGASAQQVGDNTTIVSQHNETSSGDAVAGSQVTGVVGGGGTVVQNSNSSFFSRARSGPALGFNIADVGAGPSAFGFLGTSQVSQVGDNDAVLLQANRTASGDALAGSQSTGVVGWGPAFVGGSNSAVLPFARSGASAARNVATGGPGPSAGGVIGGSSASQTGDNSADAAQSFVNESGDALSGSQTNGLVSQERGALSEEAVHSTF